MAVKRKYSLFISSTYEDLQEERQALVGVALDNGFIPVGMEQFHGAPADQWTVITKFIDDCDFYLLVIGGRYGSIDESVDKSYTEKEYDYAKHKGIPILVLIKNPQSITDDKKDKGDANHDKYELMKRLDAFTKRVKDDDNTVAFFDNLEGLKYEAGQSLRNSIEYADENAGWVRYRDVGGIVDEEVVKRNKANVDNTNNDSNHSDDKYNKTTTQMANNLNKMNRVLRFGLNENELKYNLQVLSRLFDDLIDMPRNTREILGRIIMIAYENQYNKWVFRVEELDTYYDSISTKGPLMTLNRKNFISDFDQDDYSYNGYDERSIYEIEDWNVWEDIRRFCEETKTDISRVCVDLDFSVFDE